MVSGRTPPSHPKQGQGPAQGMGGSWRAGRLGPAHPHCSPTFRPLPTPELLRGSPARLPLDPLALWVGCEAAIRTKDGARLLLV